MAGLVPAIHVFLAEGPQDVDARDKRGHDAGGGSILSERLDQAISKFESYAGHSGARAFSPRARNDQAVHMIGFMDIEPLH
jgi:hypothetical protein